MKPGVSIISVVRNDRSGLEATWASIRQQSSDEFEWVVIDGASSDGTAELCGSLFETGLAIGTSGVDRGIYDAMNRGLGFCTRSHVLFLNAGDVLADANVISQLDDFVCLKSRRSTLVCGDYYFCVGGSSIVRTWSSGKEWYTMPTSHQAILWPVQNLGAGYDIRFRIKGDFELYRRLKSQGIPEVYCGFPIAKFYDGGVSSSTSGVWQGLREHWAVEKEVTQAGRFRATAATLRCGVSAISRMLACRALQGWR